MGEKRKKKGQRKFLLAFTGGKERLLSWPGLTPSLRRKKGKEGRRKPIRSLKSK